MDEDYYVNYNPNTQFAMKSGDSTFIISKDKVHSYDVHRDSGGMTLKLHAEGFVVETYGDDAIFNFNALNKAFPNVKEDNDGICIGC